MSRSTGPERALWLTAVLSFCCALAALVASTADPRQLAGEGVWAKPMKFGLSTGLYAATLAWAVSALGFEARRSLAPRIACATASACSLFEIGYIAIQAARARPSHFNLSTPFHAAMYSLMAAAAIALVLCAAVVGLMALRDREMAVPQPVRWGIICSFLASAALSILTGLAMGGRLSHHAGLEPSGAARVPFTGWSLAAGDLRIPHFLGLHLMQAGPVFAALVGRIASGRLAAVLTAGFCGLWVAATSTVLGTMLDVR